MRKKFLLLVLLAINVGFAADNKQDVTDEAFELLAKNAKLEVLQGFLKKNVTKLDFEKKNKAEKTLLMAAAAKGAEEAKVVSEVDKRLPSTKWTEIIIVIGSVDQELTAYLQLSAYDIEFKKEFSKETVMQYEAHLKGLSELSAKLLKEIKN